MKMVTAMLWKENEKRSIRTGPVNTRRGNIAVQIISNYNIDTDYIVFEIYFNPIKFQFFLT